MLAWRDYLLVCTFVLTVAIWFKINSDKEDEK